MIIFAITLVIGFFLGRLVQEIRIKRLKKKLDAKIKERDELHNEVKLGIARLSALKASMINLRKEED